MRQKVLDRGATIAQQSNDILGRAISQPDPDDLWRRPMKNAEPMEVFILAHDDKTTVSRMPPYYAIGSTEQAHIGDMNRPRV